MASIQDHNGYNQGFKRTKTFKVRIERRAKMMISQMEVISENTKILEIGCGTGEISNYIANNTKAKVLGIDICEEFIQIAESEYKSQNLKFDTINFLRFETFQEGKYDYIIGNGILHHLYHDLDKSLKIINDLLKINGKIIFMEPNINNPYCFLIFKYFRDWANLDPGEMAFSKNHIKNILLKSNFSNINVSYKDFLLPNTPYILVKPIIILSDILEKIYPINLITQSIFIIADKKQ